MKWLIVGLGNPGPTYVTGRHNVGFQFLSTFQSTYDFPNFRAQGRTQLSIGNLDGVSVGLVMPMAYMNLSGQALAPVVHFYKINSTQLIVIHDDLDLPCGSLRFKKGGGHGGHRGLSDIDKHLGQEYARIRVGIDHPGEKALVSSYVLSSFSAQQLPFIQEAQQKTMEALPLLLSGDEEGFRNRIRG